MRAHNLYICVIRHTTIMPPKKTRVPALDTVWILTDLDSYDGWHGEERTQTVFLPIGSCRGGSIHLGPGMYYGE